MAQGSNPDVQSQSGSRQKKIADSRRQTADRRQVDNSRDEGVRRGFLVEN
jgi:hypothetical protein